MGKTFLYIVVFALLFIQIVRSEKENYNTLDLVEESDHVSSKIGHSFKNGANTKLKFNENAQLAECKCDKGKCVEKDGKSVCTCDAEFGVYEYAGKVECRPCNCGKESNCTMDVTMWSTTINCICKDGYKVERKSCKGPCTKNPCKNGGTCADENKTYKCICPSDYIGKQCENKNPCSSNPCQNNGNCTVSGTSFKCDCNKPYYGDQCEKDPCTTQPCQNNGTCSVGKVGFICSCKTPFSGKKCENDPCSSNPCENGGTCNIADKSFSCSCMGNFWGDKCEKECICEHGHCRKDSSGEIECVCPPGFGKYSTHLCEECNCGEGANCTFDGGLLSDGKKCICPFNFQETKGKCDDACTSAPCKNGGICQPKGKSFICTCKKPYYGDACENDPCTDKPCKNNGKCVLDGNSFKCDCKDPFSGKTCEGDPCTDNPCKNDGKCVLDGNSFKCDCKDPFSGKTCEGDPCTDNPCKNDGKCVLDGNSFKCDCKDPFSGKTCEGDPCTDNPCKNDGKCVLDGNSFKCDCKDPFSGKTCEGDPCTDNPCKNDGKCVLDGNSFKCDCKDSFSGKTCEEDPCTDNPCKNEGKCTLEGNSFKCDCKVPFSGKTCEEDPCINNPCWNGGTCKLEGSSFKCDCKAPYFGNTCGEDPCTSAPCLHDGTCAVNETSFVCQCIQPHFGATCEKDPCTDKPCSNGGNCKLHESSYICDCIPPYSGPQCELNPCTDSPCKNSGTCQLTESNFKCICESPYSGQLCEDDLCTNNPCKNRGNCTIENKEYKCSCPKPFYGKNCDEDACTSVSCLHGGTCEARDNSFFCHCVKPYFGETCDSAIDPCAENPCANGGSCKPKGFSYTCDCIPPYFGSQCHLTPCTNNPCKNNGACELTKKNFKCNCESPYSGNLCDHGPCTDEPCKNHGNCTVENKEFKCSCPEPFYGKNCDKECKCKNGVCAKDNSGDLQCQCPPEYGHQGNDVCEDCNCGKNANCTFEKNWFLIGYAKTCVCPKGYEEHGGVCEEIQTTTKILSTITTNQPISKYTASSTTKYISTDGTIDTSTINQSTPDITTDLQNITEEFNRSTNVPTKYTTDFNGTTDTPSIVTHDFNSTTFSPSRFTEDFNGTTHVPSRFTQDFNGTTHVPSRFTEDFNGTTHVPSRFTEDFNGTTHVPSRFTEDFNGTTHVPSRFTEDFNGTTHVPSRFTEDFNGTTPVPSHSTQYFNGTTFFPSNFTRDLNGTTESLSNFTYDFSDTTYSPTNFTFDFNGTTYMPSNFTHDFNETTYAPSNTTNSENVTQVSKSTEFTIETSNPPVFSSTVSVPDVCKGYCKNGGTCLVTKDGAQCSCTYPYSGKTCEESQWCTEGLGKTLCPGDSCVFNFTSRIGRCNCPKDHYFNFEKKACEVIDMCALQSKICTGPNEICRNGACECKENFKRNDKKECEPKFCNAEPHPCSENELCEDIVTDPGNVKCTCKEGFLFDGKTCRKSKKCTLPSTLGCQHSCHEETESCTCKTGFALQPNNKTCVLTDAGNSCKKSCGVGVCVKTPQGEVCICPRTHISRSTCIDLCAAKNIPDGVCPNNECMSDEKLGFKCKCEGKLTLDQNGVTCRKRLMCSEGKNTEVCKKKNALCVEDYEEEEGFRCDCKQGEEADTDGICKSKCALKQHQEHCSKLLATCGMDGFEVICICPPMLTFNKDDGKCTELAKQSYTAMLPVSPQKSDGATKQTKYVSFAQKKHIVIDFFKITADVRASMHQLYGQNYQFANVLNCVISSDKMNCLVEMQFQSDPKDQVNLISDPNICLSIDAETCFIPPGLVLSKQDIKSDMFTPTDPCSKGIKERNCGSETDCKKVNSDTNNFECACSAGFRSYGYYQPLSDERTIIHKCQDIDECLQPKACPNRTRCLNTYGSYECPCQSGFKPSVENSDTKSSGCVEICNAKMCGHGKCEVTGDMYRCHCAAGYIGLSCDEDEPITAGPAGMKVAMIILSTLVVPLVLLSVYMVYKYHLLKKKTYKSNYLDDQSSTINLQPLRSGGSRHDSRFS